MKKILVVDDDVDIANSVKIILEKNKYKVVIVRDSKSCLKAVSKENPDLIILDLLMPDSNIDELLTKIKDVKVILYSVISINEQNIAETGDMLPTKEKYPNIADVIGKPGSAKEILEKVKKALR